MLAKSENKSGLQNKMVKHYENNVFRVIYVSKKRKERLRSGPFPRDGRVTGNKHLFLLGIRPENKNVGFR